MKLPEKDYDPVLKEAIEEIKAIIKKHDIGGAVLLHGKNHSEFLMEISPSWSCMELEHIKDGAYGIRFKAKIATGPKHEQERAAWTAGMIMSLTEETAFLNEQFTKLAAMLGKHMGIEHISKMTHCEPENE